MGYEWFIGLRYLRAKKRTTFVSVITFISILGITVGVTALIVVISVMTGFEEDLREKILGVNAHIAVMEFGGPMDGYKDVASRIKKVDRVKGVTPFIYNQALLSSKGNVTGVVVRGIDLDSFSEVTVLAEKMREGGFDGLKATFKGGSLKGELPGVVIGMELAKSLGVWVNDEINVIAPFGDARAIGGAPRMARFKVSGIFEVGMYEYDSSLAFISLENAMTFFKLDSRVTGIEVKLDNLYDADRVKEDISSLLGGYYWIRTWMETNKNLFSALKLEKAAMFIILLLIVVVAALNIISTLIMVVMEKTKEIAILKGIGATSAGIMRIFMIEGAVIGIVGTLLGTVIGVLCAINLEGIVSFIEEVFKFKVLPPSVYYIDKLPSKVTPAIVLTIMAVSLCISFLATIYPSWKASRLDPAEGLRYE